MTNSFFLKFTRGEVFCFFQVSESGSGGFWKLPIYKKINFFTWIPTNRSPKFVSWRPLGFSLSLVATPQLDICSWSKYHFSYWNPPKITFLILIRILLLPLSINYKCFISSRKIQICQFFVLWTDIWKSK